MGQFSFKTQDVKKSVSSLNADTVWLISPSGETWREDKYEGYGVFGGKDIYELLSELNGGESNRGVGIGLAFDGNTYGENPNLVWPNLVRKKARYTATYGAIKSCPDQGWV